MNCDLFNLCNNHSTRVTMSKSFKIFEKLYDLLFTVRKNDRPDKAGKLKTVWGITPFRPGDAKDRNGHLKCLEQDNCSIFNIN
jgi:hypothetical protein